MIDFRLKISKLYQNEKIGDIFAQSDGGQGMIDQVIESSLTFNEIKEISQLGLSSGIFLQFLQEHDSYPNVTQFISRLNNKISLLIELYLDAKKIDNIEKIILNNQELICKAYPMSFPKDSFIEFYKDYLRSYKKLSAQTFSENRQFFNSPIDYVINNK